MYAVSRHDRFIEYDAVLEARIPFDDRPASYLAKPLPSRSRLDGRPLADVKGEGRRFEGRVEAKLLDENASMNLEVTGRRTRLSPRVASAVRGGIPSDDRSRFFPHQFEENVDEPLFLSSREKCEGLR